MQWEIAAASAVVWHVDRGDVRRRAHVGRMRHPQNPKAMQLAVVWDREWGAPVFGSFRLPFLELP